MNNNFDHIFVICAYKESPYLEECIKSVLAQSVEPRVALSTSTPNDFVKGLAAKYNIELFINTGKGDMTGHWNFVYQRVAQQYVTICHQDDIYGRDFLKSIKEAALKAGDDIIILHTAWLPYMDGKILRFNPSALVHRVLNFPTLFFKSCRWLRLRALAFGNCVKIPTVTYNKKVLGQRAIFTSPAAFLPDWHAAIDFAELKGKFVYINKSVFLWRVHRDSGTTMFTQNGLRQKEEIDTFLRFWPAPLARIIAAVYKFSYSAYK